MPEYPILGFAPSLPEDLPGVIVASSQVLPTDRGIGNGVSISALSSSVTGPALGAAQLSDYGGIVLPDRYIGTATKLYWLHASLGSADDVSGGTYNATSTNTWSFATFGNISLAVNHSDTLQAANSFTGGSFAAVSGAPKASIVITPGLPTTQFAMLFDYDDGSNAYNDGIFWSALSDYTDWTPSIATECGNIRVIDINGGWRAAIPFRDGVVAFKRRSMYLGTYVGGAAVWSWTRISSDVGCVGKNALCVANDVLYFADEAGLWMYDGSYPKPMPGYVHQWWADAVAAALALSTDCNNFARLTWDVANHQLWAGIGAAPGIPAPNSHIVFNARSQLWTYYGVLGDGTNQIQSLVAPDCATLFGTTTAFYKINRATSLAGSFRLAAHGSTYGMTTISGCRPQFSVGPSDTAMGWLAGTLYYGPTVRNVTTQSKAMSFAPPGRLDVTQQDRFVAPQFDFTAGIAWECTKMAVDVKTNPVGE